LTANAGQCIISRVYRLNLRSAPAYDAAIVTVLSQGAVTTLTGNRSGEWVQIRTLANQIGWINRYYCGAGQPAQAPAPPPASHPSVMVDVDALYVRSGPGLHYNVVDLVYRGAMVQLAGERDAAGAWVTVITANNVQGWAYAPYLWIMPEQLAQLRVVGGGSSGARSVGTATVNVNALNIRYGPGLGYGVLGGAYYGQVLGLYGTRTADNLWVSVVLADGSVGWAYAPYLILSVPYSALAAV
jgi:N-acetylmuramoyl-L-alanine amidase